MKRFSTLLCGTALSLALTGAAFAGTVSKTLTFQSPVTVNGTTLQPGDYKVTYDDNSPNTQLTFKKGKKDVATVPAQVKQVGTKTHTTSVTYNTQGSTQSIQQIQFGGSTEALVLSEAGSNSTSGQ
jgi:hypothetical protein